MVLPEASPTTTRGSSPSRVPGASALSLLHSALARSAEVNAPSCTPKPDPAPAPVAGDSGTAAASPGATGTVSGVALPPAADAAAKLSIRSWASLAHLPDECCLRNCWYASGVSTAAAPRQSFSSTSWPRRCRASVTSELSGCSEMNCSYDSLVSAACAERQSLFSRLQPQSTSSGIATSVTSVDRKSTRL